MKKCLNLLLCVLLAMVLALPTMAAAPDRPDGAEALGEAWAWYEAVPDYASGFWLDENGRLTVGLVNEAGRDEVLAIVGDAPVNFVSHPYSYNELCAIQNALMEYYESDVGLMTLSVDVINNIAEVGLEMENPNAAAFMEEIAAVYGEKVVFRDMTGMQIIPVTGTKPPAIDLTALPGRDGAKTRTTLPVTAICIAGLAGAAWLLVRSRQMTRQAQMIDGRTVTSSSVTRKETEDAVKQAVADPDTTLRDIVEKLEK